MGRRIEAVLPEVEDVPRRDERAQREGARRSRLILRRRISVLIGPAGTGKTTMLEALCDDDEHPGGGILLLAPTGKAAVQLAPHEAAALTLAQFLRRHDAGTTSQAPTT